METTETDSTRKKVAISKALLRQAELEMKLPFCIRSEGAKANIVQVTVWSE